MAILPSMVSMRASGTLWPLAQHPIATSLYINGVHMVCLSHGTAWNIPNGITTEPPHRRTRDGASRSVLCDNVVPALPRIFASHPKSPASHSEKRVCGGRVTVIGNTLLANGFWSRRRGGWWANVIYVQYSHIYTIRFRGLGIQAILGFVADDYMALYVAEEVRRKAIRPFWINE